MRKVKLFVLLLFAFDASAEVSVTTVRLADRVDETKREALVASENLRKHMVDLWSKYRSDEGAGDCLEYGSLLQRAAAERVLDADLVMTAITNDGPPTLTQRFSAAVIYASAKQDLEKAVANVDKCFSLGGPFR